VLSGSELWLLRLMADRGLALLDASALLMVIEERGELRVAAASGEVSVRVRILPVDGSALGALHRAGTPLSLDRPRGHEAAWLHELGLEARAVLVEPLKMEGHGGGLVIALRTDGGFRDPDRRALNAFATSVAQRLAAERSVEIERLRYGMEARERERTRWAREIHDETVQGLGALRLKLANARDVHEDGMLNEAVDAVLEGLGTEIEGLRHLITELRPAALDDLGLIPALEALARRAQAIDGLVMMRGHVSLLPTEGVVEEAVPGDAHNVLGERTRSRIVVLVPYHLGEVLDEGASASDIEQLHAPADRKHGQARALGCGQEAELAFVSREARLLRPRVRNSAVT